MQVYTLEITPMSAPRMTHNQIKGFKGMLKSSKRQTRQLGIRIANYMSYKSQLQELSRQIGLNLSGRIDLIQFYIPIPPSIKGKKRAARIGQPHLLKPDVDNLLKAFMDSLEKEDSHVWSVSVDKIWVNTKTGYINVFIFNEEERQSINNLIQTFKIVSNEKNNHYYQH